MQFRGEPDHFHVSRHAIERCGPTDGCPACISMFIEGTTSGRVCINHNDKCRERTMTAMRSDPKYRQLVQKHEVSIGAINDNNDDDDNNNKHDHRAGKEIEIVRLMEQRGHVGQAIHVVKQQMRMETCDITTQLYHVMLQMMVPNMDVAGFCSPPRIAGMAAHMGLRAGWGMDVTTQDDDGRAWDFNVLEMRNRAARRVIEDKPLLLIGSPRCRIHSVMNHANHARMGPEIVEARFRHARRHLEFAAKFYKLQVQGGRYLLHEHPESASSWRERSINEVLETEGVMKVIGDQCRYGLRPRDEQGEGAAKEPTGFMKNPPCVAVQLKRSCPNRAGYQVHRHVQVQGG